LGFDWRLLIAMQHSSKIDEKALAWGFRMVKMMALSCGATGTRPPAIP
jgi:hypothetical protein